MKNKNKPKKMNKFRILSLLLVFTFSMSTLNADMKNFVLRAAKTDVLSHTILELENNIREAGNMQELRTSPLLEKAAQQKAEDMALKGYFSHTTPEGYSPWYWLKKVGFNFIFAGEILAVKFDDSESVVRAWMLSPLHKANIVNKNFTHTGIGIAKGVYKGVETEYVVQFFGTIMPSFEDFILYKR